MNEYITKSQAIDLAESLRPIAGNGITDAFIKGIEGVEAADTVEHGRWKLFKHDREWYAECSECGAVFGAVEAALFNACPTCRAIMDE